MNAIEIAKKLIKKGYNVIPTNSSKNPVGINWGKFQKVGMIVSDVENYFKPHYSIAILTGGTTRVVCLDADMKYDITGDLWDRFYNEVPENIKEQCMLQSTQNGGYHLVFKAPITRLFGNEKLASRPTTAEEKHRTYIENFNDIETKDRALKIAINDSERVLFETRSGSPELCGGYFLCAPSAGYTHVSGKVGELTEEMYDDLMKRVKTLKQVHKPIKTFDGGENWEISPWDDYNERSDVLSLLVENGWKIISNGKKDMKLLRPGKVQSTHSAIFDNDSKIFFCYTSSTSFDPNEGYTPSGVFIELECEGNKGIAFRKLIEMGYGKETN